MEHFLINFNIFHRGWNHQPANLSNIDLPITKFLLHDCVRSNPNPEDGGLNNLGEVTFCFQLALKNEMRMEKGGNIWPQETTHEKTKGNIEWTSRNDWNGKHEENNKKHILCNEWIITMVIYIWLLYVIITSIEVDKTCWFTISVPTRTVSEFMGYLALGCLGVTHAVADWRHLGTISRGFGDWWNGDFTRKRDGLTWFNRGQHGWPLLTPYPGLLGCHMMPMFLKRLIPGFYPHIYNYIIIMYIIYIYVNIYIYVIIYIYTLYSIFIICYFIICFK